MLRRVQKVEVVSKTTVYGYYPGPQWFVKISLRYPDDVPFTVKLLEVARLMLLFA
jgi:hypothetical protein